MSAPDDELKALAEREKQLHTGLSNSDIAILDEILAKEFTYFHHQGIAESKPENLSGHKSGLYAVGAIKQLSRYAKVSGAVAVTSGRTEMIDRARGANVELHLEQTMVWIKQGALWHLLLLIETRTSP